MGQRAREIKRRRGCHYPYPERLRDEPKEHLRRRLFQVEPVHRLLTFKQLDYEVDENDDDEGVTQVHYHA